MVTKPKRKMPDILTLENLRAYALGLLEDGDIEEAETALRRVLLVDPDDAKTLFALGELMHDVRGDKIEAQDFYERAIESQPDHLPALKRLAWLHTQRRFDTNEYGAYEEALQHKRDDDAEACYRKAVKVCPHDPDVLGGFGSFMYHVKRDQEQAQECFSTAVQLNPNHVESHIN
mmetsp:Transcript_1917/g.4527  ORF Transcript_1917/g.4527 Transcript_1917/m.4527 type:complete len:175 (-) Transcript_1917:1-525(-)